MTHTTKGVFPGEDPRHHMRKTRVERPKVSCGSCRQFDGNAWCNRWNYATSADSPPCDQYRALRVE